MSRRVMYQCWPNWLGDRGPFPHLPVATVQNRTLEEATASQSKGPETCPLHPHCTSTEQKTAFMMSGD
jgi:hypothetical protein